MQASLGAFHSLCFSLHVMTNTIKRALFLSKSKMYYMPAKRSQHWVIYQAMILWMLNDQSLLKHNDVPVV